MKFRSQGNIDLGDLGGIWGGGLLNIMASIDEYKVKEFQSSPNVDNWHKSRLQAWATGESRMGTLCWETIKKHPTKWLLGYGT